MRQEDKFVWACVYLVLLPLALLLYGDAGRARFAVRLLMAGEALASGRS